MYNPNYQNWGLQGWRCPECGRVYSPTTPMCFYCSNKETTIQTDKTTVIPFDDKGWWDSYQRGTSGDAKSLEQTWKQFTTSKVDIEITPSSAILYHGPTMECYL